MAQQVSTNELKGGFKVEVEGEPTARVVEKTFKSGEKLDLADVDELKMRMLYKEAEGAVFMDDNSFEQLTVPMSIIGDKEKWLLEETIYDIVVYKGEVVDINPPTFLEMVIVEAAPGVRGDTSSGRVLKPAITETGAKIQVPIFIDQGEKIKVDTRTGDYVSRV